MGQTRLLVVGGSGFIGRYVVERGLHQKWHVTSIGLHAPKVSKKTARAQYIEANITQASSLESLGDNKFDYVVNLGGYIDHELFGAGGRRAISSHFDGLLNLLEFLDRSTIKLFIQIGSSDEYGNVAAPQHERLRESPITPYSLAKVAATHFLQMLNRTEGFPAVILRLFLAYGPGQDNQRFLPQIIQGCLENRQFPVSGGVQIRDFCYVEDIVDAVFRCFDCQSATGVLLNIASGEPTQVREIIEFIVQLIGSGRPQFGKVPYRTGENMSLYADISAAREILNWSPRWTLFNGLNTTIDWVRSKNA
jgi:nucleoside-diphosphate-sugar epimerase